MIHVISIASLLRSVDLRPNDMLGIEILWDSATSTITILHCAEAQVLTVSFGVEGERRGTTMTPAAHFAAMLDVTWDVGSTEGRGVNYSKSSVPVKIWRDANFAGCSDTWHSVSGWVVVCFGGAVSWESCKQPMRGVSTMDADSEYQACGSVA
jgi:hypothetical protein